MIRLINLYKDIPKRICNTKKAFSESNAYCCAEPSLCEQIGN